MLIFRNRAHLRTFAHCELSRPGGAAKILPPRRAKRHAHVPFFVGGLPRTPSQPGNITRPGGGYYRLGATNPFKAAFPFFRASEEKQAKRSVLKGLVARSARRCAAFDPGGSGPASSRDITPMCHAVRASSPNVMAHAVARSPGVSGDRRPRVGCILKARRRDISRLSAHCFFSRLSEQGMGAAYGDRVMLPYPAPTGIIMDGKMSQQLSDLALSSSPKLQQPQGQEPASLHPRAR